MKNHKLYFLLGACFAVGLIACEQTTDNMDGLPIGGGYDDPFSTGGGEVEHSNDPNAADPSASFPGAEVAAKKIQNALVGSPDVASRLHGCGKLGYDSLGALLRSRGVTVGAAPAGNGNGNGRGNGNGNAAATPSTAGAIYNAGSAALGVANYIGRVPEASFYSTSALAKQMDIFAMAASEIVGTAWAATACPGVKLFAGDDFTKEGITCLIGKPARDEHVAIANAAVKAAADPSKGKQIAVAALLSAAHSCE